MSRVRIPYVDHFTDRHGTLRYYFRRPGGKRTPLPGPPGSPAFMDAYQAAFDAAPGAPQQKQRGEAGTFDRLLADYLQSPDCLRLKAPTQRAYRLAMERLVRLEGIGHRKVVEMRREHVKAIMARRADRPSAANGALKKLRILIRFAIDLGLRHDDPTLALKKFREGEHHTWTDEELEAFERHWPIGSRERTAYALLLFTGQRLSDVARMSWRDVSADGGRIGVVQDKTGAKLSIPLHPDLMAALAMWPKAHLAILTTVHGKPFTTKGFGNNMADAIGAAGLPDRCVTHGIRKASSRRLAEAGCTAHEIAAVTGHRSLSEIERYTRAASQQRLSTAGILKLPARGVPTPITQDFQPTKKL